MIHITKARHHNGNKSKWIQYDKEVTGPDTLELLRTLLKIRHESKYVDFVFKEKQ